MSKYIRTEDGIREYEEIIERIKYWYTNVVIGDADDNIKRGIEDFDKEIIKQGDTIEELCNEFVFDVGDDAPLLCTYEELIYWFNHSKEQQYRTRNQCFFEYVNSLFFLRTLSAVL